MKVTRVLKKFSFAQLMLFTTLVLICTFTALPLIALVSRSFMPLEELFRYPPRIIVRNPTPLNFSDLLTALSASAVPFTRYIFNSLFVSITTVVLTILVSSAGAYALVKHKPPMANFIFAFVLGALMFSHHVTRIPNYMVVNQLGMLDTYWSLIIPRIAVAYNFFLVKQFCEQLPDSILEAARIDGATELRTFWTIAMPLLKPAWSTLAVLAFVENWNDFFSPLIFITNDAMQTLPVAMQTISGGAGVVARQGAVAAAALITTMPTVIIFVMMKSRVMQTMAFSGIKS